jgi:hypothetical protein
MQTKTFPSTLKQEEYINVYHSLLYTVFIYTFTFMIAYLLQTRIHCYEEELAVYRVA